MTRIVDQHFRTKAEIDAWAKGREAREDERYDQWKFNWQGEGFYRLSSGSVRCPRGCCYDSALFAEPLDWVLMEKLTELSRLECEVNEIKTLINYQEPDDE